MIIITSFRVILCFLCTLPSLAFPYDEKQDVAQEESRTVNTFATRSDDGQRAQVVTGTFRFVSLLWIHEFMNETFSLRFRRVVNRDANMVSGKPSGWDIEGIILFECVTYQSANLLDRMLLCCRESLFLHRESKSRQNGS